MKLFLFQVCKWGRRAYCLPEIFGLAAVIFLSAQGLFAQTDIYIQGSGRLFPIAVPQLCLADGQSSAVREIPEVIARNLDISGEFEVLEPNSYIEEPGKCTGPDDFAYSDWSVIGAEGLVRGVVFASEEGFKVQMFLHDVQRRRVVLGKEYTGRGKVFADIAHKFSNEIVRYFTGVPGVFGSKIVFSSRVGRFKELFTMDMNGTNVRPLTNDRGLAISSSFSPRGDRVVYTSYRSRVPDLFSIDVDTRRISQITRSRALELGGKKSSRSELYLASVSMGRDSDIVLLRPNGEVYRYLTKGNGAIDVSPDWSPDESKIVFVSNRAGGPQIYVMNADGRNAKRISFVRSNYCTSPSWSPTGKRIAFVCRAEGAFQIFTTNPDGSEPLQLTTYGNNEDPDWAPNGRYLVFASTLGRGPVFHLAIMRDDGTNLRQISKSRGGDTQPSWGPVP